MLAAAAHRGPDGTGVWMGSGAALGHLALKLALEDQHEEQPLVDAESGSVVVADARLDNREDLIRQLGGDIRGEGSFISDARLMLLAYRRWGEACVEHLLGDFAFAVWDAAKRRLFAARDAMGMRPLFYYRGSDKVYLSSEVAQLLDQPGVPVEINECMAAAYLTGQPMPLEWTFHRDIAQLPPGHAVIFEPGRQKTWRYWDIDPGRKLRYRSEGDYAEHLRELFKAAVGARLRGVKPAGLMLSGGMDSSAIAATGGWLLQGERRDGQVPQLRTYSFAFEQFPECDERNLSRITTEAFGLAARDIPKAYPLDDYYPEQFVDRDEPSCQIYEASHERVYRQARRDGVGVMMSGDRGDTLIGCCIDVLGLLTSAQWGEFRTALRRQKRHSRPFRNILAKRVILPALMPLWPLGRFASARRRLWGRMVGQSSVPPYPDWMRPEFAERVGLADAVTWVEAPPGISASARRERYEAIFVEMHMRQMPQVERHHARLGLAFADPWSDRRLAEFVMATPQHLLHQRGDEKRLVRRAMTGILPEEVRLGARKVSLGPVYQYAIEHTARDAILDLIANSQAAARGFVDETKLLAFYEGVCRGENGVLGLWEYLSLERWLRAHWR